jgi:hypothetical protein
MRDAVHAKRPDAYRPHEGGVAESGDSFDERSAVRVR